MWRLAINLLNRFVAWTSRKYLPVALTDQLCTLCETKEIHSIQRVQRSAMYVASILAQESRTHPDLC